MAMTKEELVDLIDNTINTNGEKAITGQALNLALKEIVEAMGSGGSGASMVLNISMSAIQGGENDLTDEQIAENVQLYDAMIAAKNAPTSISIYSKLAMDGEGLFWGQCPYWLVGEKDGETIAIVVIAGLVEFSIVMLAADGSVSGMGGRSLSLSSLKI